MARSLASLASTTLARICSERTQAVVAAAVDVSQPMISIYLSGQSRPGDDVRERFEALYSIPRGWWTLPPPGEAATRPRGKVRTIEQARAKRASRCGRKASKKARTS
jgi:transcriptional regulator with XRE-family HTH domain